MTNQYHLTIGSCVLMVSIFSSCQQKQEKTINEKDEKKPNIIILFTDDQGYADVGCFGAKGFETPNLDNMAEEGMKFSDFYVPAASCAPSRMALLTGCYPARNYVSQKKPDNAIDNLTPMSELDMDQLSAKDLKYVERILKEQPDAKLARHTWGPPASEVTLAEMLKQEAYKTMMYGKWHLGEAPQHHPTKHGFDNYYGVSQSISVSPFDRHPYNIKNHIWFPNQPFYEDDSVVAYNVDSSKLTKQYTNHAINYIKANKDKNFFIYLAYAMPHVPIGVTDRFRGASERGLYGDVIMEIDWSVGKILQTLKEEKLDSNTLVIFTSDNGPWLNYGEHAGSAEPLREGKGTYFEGGVREPCIMWWPGTIPAGKINNNPAMTIDLMPTIAEITNTELPDHKIDGKSILPMLKDPDKQSPQDAYYFFNMGNFAKYGDLVAIRKGDWKLFFPYKYNTLHGKPGGKNGKPVSYEKDSIGLSLFNLKKDISESNNVAGEHRDIVNEMKEQAEQFKQSIKNNQRPVDWIKKE